MTTRQWVRLVIVYLFIPLILFVTSGDLGWWQAWVFGVLIVAVGIGSRLWAERRHPGLLAERMHSSTAAGVKPWDKLLAPLMAVSISFPLCIVAGLDHRLGWSPAFPLWLNLLGFILIIIGYLFATWALAENRFFSGAVRIQTERGHSVCDTGPYRIVRHPGYAGNILPLPGMALAFSSVWTLIPAAVALVITIIRRRWRTGCSKKSCRGTKSMPCACATGCSRGCTSQAAPQPRDLVLITDGTLALHRVAAPAVGSSPQALQHSC